MSGDTTAGKRKILEGFGQKPYPMDAQALDHMGCLLGCADYLGLGASSAWLFGISGYAFVIHVHEGLCPSGPYAWPMQVCDMLCANAGLGVSRLDAAKGDDNIAEKRREFFEKVRTHIDSGHPCVGWDMEESYWYPICGYDEEGNYLYRAPSGEIKERHHTLLGETEIGMACILLTEKIKPSSEVHAFRHALAFATQHHRSKFEDEARHAGIAAFDAWITALAPAQQDDVGEHAGIGQALHAGCYAECRKQAVRFLEEAKDRLAGSLPARLLEEAVTHYERVASNLGTLAEIFPPGEGMNDRIKDANKREKASRLLMQARDAESRGLETLGRIHAALTG